MKYLEEPANKSRYEDVIRKLKIDISDDLREIFKRIFVLEMVHGIELVRTLEKETYKNQERIKELEFKVVALEKKLNGE
jgi:hypothetical protein